MTRVSFLHNQEANAVGLGTDFGTRMRGSIDADVAQSEQRTLEQWQRRPLGDRSKESLSRIWQHWR